MKTTYPGLKTCQPIRVIAAGNYYFFIFWIFVAKLQQQLQQQKKQEPKRLPQLYLTTTANKTGENFYNINQHSNKSISTITTTATKSANL